ncbi:MAG: hypothetical protein R6X02_32165 [Enhygromyxa sp.]
MIALAPLEGWAEAGRLERAWLLLSSRWETNEMQFSFAIGAIALLLAAVAWRTLILHRRQSSDPATPNRWLRWGDRMISAALLVAALCSATQYFYAQRNGKSWLHTWDIYHQVIGAKYFEELGYFKLYECTWEIDEINSGHFKNVKEMRNIKTLAVKPVHKVVGERDCVDRFEPERLEQFAQDIDDMVELGGARMFNKLFGDKGFNGTPFHAWILGQVTDGVPIVKEEYLWLGLLDVWLMLLAFAAIAWAWDLKTASIIALFFFANFPNRYIHMGGSILRFDYIAMLIFALVAMKKNRFGIAGACVAWAAAERLFPAIFAVGLAYKAGVELLATRKLRKEYLAFGVGFAVTGLILFGLSLGASESLGAGVDSWREWWHNMRVHTLHTRGFRVGFKHMFMMDGNVSDSDGFVGWTRKTEFFHTRDHFYYLTVLLLFAPLLLAVRKLDAVTFAALFAAAGFFFLAVATRYYYSMMVLFLLVDRKLFEDRKQLLLAALLFLTAAWLAKIQTHTSSVPFHYNTATSAAFAGYYVILAALLWIDPWLRDRKVVGAEREPKR